MASHPWWKMSQWHVETISVQPQDAGQWIPIYSTSTKKKAQEDAREWTRRTGSPTRVVPGPGHRSLREATGTVNRAHASDTIEDGWNDWVASRGEGGPRMSSRQYMRGWDGAQAAVRAGISVERIGSPAYHAALKDLRSAGLVGQRRIRLRDTNRARGSFSRKSPLTAAIRVTTLASLGVSYDPSLFYSVKGGKLYARARTGGGGYGRGRLGKATLLGTIPGFKKGLFYSVSKGVVSVRRRK